MPKLGILLIGGIASSVVISVAIFDKNISSSVFTHDIDIFVNTESPGTDLADAEIITNEGSENFLCRLEGKTETFKCLISKPKITETKNHIQSSEFLTETTDSEVTKEKIKIPDKLYKLSVQTTEFNWSQDHKTKIEVIAKDDPKIYSKLSVWFVVDRGEFEGAAQYFIGKASEKVDSMDGYQCSWSEEENKKDCSIYDFSSNESAGSEGFKGLTFVKHENETPTKSTKIEKDKHYLIKFEDQQIKGFKKTTITFSKPAVVSPSVVAAASQADEAPPQPPVVVKTDIEFLNIKIATLSEGKLLVF